MNTTTKLIALTALSLGIAGGAFAQEATVFAPVQAESSVSRAEVRAQAIEALNAGELSEFAILNQVIEPETSLSRQDVRQATLKALRNGSVARINAEAHQLG